MNLFFSKYIALLALLLMAGTAWGQVTLTGTVVDKTTREPLPGATVFIADLKTGAVADVNGQYRIPNLPGRRFLVQVKFIGYTTLTETLDLAATAERDFELANSALEAMEIVVTGSAFTTDRDRSSMAVVAIDKRQLLASTSGNLIAAIAKTPGISEITTGNGISKPVIRGLGYNRIVTIDEGVRQEGQQWGDEHGIEIDQFSADRIEVLKGPASLLYGSDALGGVINILEPLPAPLNTIRGEVSTQYATNNAFAAASAMMEGNLGGFVWRARGTYKNAAPYRTPVERVYNSAYNELNGEGFVGVNKKWGFSHLHFTKWTGNIGLVEGERDSATGKFVDFEGRVASEADLKSREIFLPRQNVQHLKFASVNSIYFNQSHLTVNAGFQQNDRREFSEPTEAPGLYFHLNTLTYDVKYYFPQKNNVETVVGVQGMNQRNENRGNEFLVPDYGLADLGALASVKKSYERFTMNAGLRYDLRRVKGRALSVNGETLFAPFQSTFSALSGSVGATYRLNETFNLKTNIGRGFRAPNISELSANGIHEGTFRYEVGDPDLKPETSLQFDAGVTAETKSVSAGIDAFYNRIDRFIYYRNLGGETTMVDGEEYPVFRYVQGNSVLWGFEASLDIHLIDALHFQNSVAFVEATNRQTGQPLPFIPATRIQNEVRYYFTFSKGSLFKDTYLSVGLDHYLAQDRFDIFETATRGYSLVNASFGTGIKLGKQIASLFINAHNLGNRRYYNHLSRLKESGVYNLGRNVSVGLTLPFGLKQ
jgi:iron complex outermembrane receptor protein